MKPYKDPRKYKWICPFSSCREKFYSGGMGHLSAKACGHLRNKHGRHLDTGFIWEYSYHDEELRIPDNIKEPIWESEFWKRRKRVLIVKENRQQ